MPVAFKVKTSSPAFFLVSPTSAILNTSHVRVRITLINPEEAIVKTHKFLIQAKLASSLDSVNWTIGIQEYIIPVKIFMTVNSVISELETERKIETNLIKPRASLIQAAVAFNNIYSKNAAIPPFVGKTQPELISPKNSNQAYIERQNELRSDIEKLKTVLEKTKAKQIFSADLEKLTHESQGTYSIIHILLIFFTSFYLGLLLSHTT